MSFSEMRRQFTKSMERPNSQNIKDQAELIWKNNSSTFENAIKNWVEVSIAASDVLGLKIEIEQLCKQLRINSKITPIIVDKAIEVYEYQLPKEPNIR